MKKRLENQNELEQDWYPNRPGMENDARLIRLAKINTTKQQKLIEMTEVPPDTILPKPNFSKVYVYKNRKWNITGFRCMDCGKVINDPDLILKHPLVCNHGLKINKNEENIMPIQKVMKNGETYYRWGQHGKLYKDRKDAEKQAQAAYASGYKEPTQKKD